MDPIAGLAAGAESIKKLSSAIEALKSIQKWIFVQPKEAAAELSRVITELMKATPAVTKATDKLLDVFDNAKPSLSVLAGVGDGSLSHEIEIIRPHCHDISRIANDYLWQWLHTPGVSGAGADSLRAFLMEIRVADDDYLNGLVKFAEAIENLAREAFNLSAQGKKDDALALIGKAAPTLFDARSKAIQLAQDLTRLQNEFRRQALGIPAA